MNHSLANQAFKAIVNNNNLNVHEHQSQYDQQQQQQQQQQPLSTEALIVNSKSSTVSSEFIAQLHEQFGADKQIFILNSNTLPSATAATSAAAISNNASSGHVNANATSNAASSSSANPPPIQYLIIDKDVDINLILQDSTLFAHQLAASTPPVVQQQQQQQQQLSNTPNIRENSKENHITREFACISDYFG